MIDDKCRPEVIAELAVEISELCAASKVSHLEFLNALGRLIEFLHSPVSGASLEYRLEMFDDFMKYTRRNIETDDFDPKRVMQ